MNILYLSQRYPYPPDRGDRIATFHHIKELSKSHRVHVASLISTNRERHQISALRAWTSSITVAFHPPWKSMLGKVQALLLGQPLSLGHFGNRKLRNKIGKVIVREKIEAIILFSSSMAPYAEPYSKLIRIMDFCDLDSLKWAALAERGKGFRAWIYRREARLLLEYERAVAEAFTASCVVSDQEAELFRSQIPGLPVTVLANGVDHDFFGAVPWRPPSELKLAFVGVMDYEPNVEGAVFFVNEIWPRIRERFPRAEFLLVGSRPSGEVLALSKVAGVTVTGFVTDVRPYLAGSSLVVVPLKIARGVQNKILEAMAAGVPVLTTPEAAGGLTPAARETLFIAERDPSVFSQMILEITADPKRLQAKAGAARDTIRQQYSWEKTGNVLNALLAEAKR